MKYLKLCYNPHNQQHRNGWILLLRSNINSNNRRSIITSQRQAVSYYSTGGSGGTTASTPLPPRPPPPPQQRQQPPPPPPPPSSSKLLPTTILLLGGAGAGLGAYYYYDPNADVFKQAKGMLGIGEEKKKMNVSLPTISKASALNESNKQQQQQQQQKLSSSVKATSSSDSKQQAEQKQQQQQKSTPATTTAAIPPPPLQKTTSSSASSSIPASATAASAIKTSQQPQAQQQQETLPPTPDFVPKNVLITALRAQQEALSESHDAKVKTIQSEYDRRLNNAAQVIEAERVVELRGKYEKASAALEAIEKGIEARTTQNERAKRLRSLWAQINALHARVNHPEYHSSTITTIDKSALLRSVQVPDKFVTQMVESLPSAPVHSLESLKSRFYGEVEPVAKSVGLIGEGEGFSLWKYLLGRVFSGGVLDVVKTEEKGGSGDGEARKSKASSPVQSTADALNSARRSLDKSDLLSAAIAINQLKGLPKQVASDWLTDARTLLETNQTLFVLMTYAASNNVF